MNNPFKRSVLGWSLSLGVAAVFLAGVLLIMTIGVSAADPEIVNTTVHINELRIDQPGTDVDEYFELMGTAGTPLTNKTYIVIGDGTGGSGVIESAVSLTSTVVPSDSHFLAVGPDYSLGGSPDLTATLNFENSDNVTHMLVNDFTGAIGDDLDTNDDGVLDIQPWSSIEDCVALIETIGSGDLVYCLTQVGPDGSFVPGQARYCPAGWEIGSFSSFSDDTPGVPNISCSVNINELRIDQPGTDNDEYFELRGLASTPLDDRSYLVIGDGVSGSGTVEAVIPLTGTVIPSGNYFLAAEGTFSLGPTPDLSVTLNFENSDNVTHMLVTGFTGALDDDLDTNDDGVLDIQPWTSLDDCVALIETVGSGDFTYCESAEVGPDGTFVPGHAYLCLAGWEIGSFSSFTDDTPRAENSLCPTTFISKEAPSVVAPGTLYTYTLTVENLSGGTLTGLVVRDTVPDNSTFASAADGGVFDGSEVVWNAGDLAHLGEVSVSFAVTATTNMTDIVNSTYSFTATNQLDPIAGEEMVTTVGNAVRIHDIQGAAHISPLDGEPVANVPGIVTALDSGSDYNGFYMQDPSPDSDDKTAEGIFVFTDGAPGVSVGDMVYVSGFVGEFRAVGFLPDFSVGPGAPNNLTITRINEPSVVIQSSGNAVPTATVIGSGGRMPPTEIIDDDTSGDVETGPTTFDPENDGIDFYESLEGMLVQVNDAVVVGARRSFGDIAVLGDNGAHATGPRTANGGIIAQETDFNPERIILTDDILSTPNVDVGDSFTSPIVGVIDYSFGNYKLQPLTSLSTASGGFTPEETTIEGGHAELTVATFNVENLSPGSGNSKFNGLADIVVTSLGSPDIIALQEIQDNNGTTDDGTVDASDTYAALIAAISTAGGPTYDWRDIAPENNQDGGAPGGNIRVGYLFNPNRVTFVDKGDGGATDAVTVTTTITGTHLSLNPGRINPTDGAWDEGRKSLAAEFLFNGETVFLINNHLKSKTEDDPLFGKYQPPVLYTEPQRNAQAQIVNDFVDAILSADANARIVVLGDMNEFQFRPALAILEGGVLDNLWSTVPITDQYTFVFDGNSQVLDHILVSEATADFATPEFDVVHVNVDRYETSQVADHEPLLVKLTIPDKIYLPIILK